MAYTPPSALSELIYSSTSQHRTSIDILRVVLQGPNRASSVYLEDQGDEITSIFASNRHGPVSSSAGESHTQPSIEILSAL